MRLIRTSDRSCVSCMARSWFSLWYTHHASPLGQPYVITDSNRFEANAPSKLFSSPLCAAPQRLAVAPISTRDPLRLLLAAPRLAGPPPAAHERLRVPFLPGGHRGSLCGGHHSACSAGRHRGERLSSPEAREQEHRNHLSHRRSHHWRRSLRLS